SPAAPPPRSRRACRTGPPRPARRPGRHRRRTRCSGRRTSARRSAPGHGRAAWKPVPAPAATARTRPRRAGSASADAGSWRSARLTIREARVDGAGFGGVGFGVGWTSGPPPLLFVRTNDTEARRTMSRSEVPGGRPAPPARPASEGLAGQARVPEGLAGQARALAAGDVSSRALVERALARIGATQPTLNAF